MNERYYIHTARYNYEEGRWEWWADHPYHTSMQAAEKQIEYLQSLYPYKKYHVFSERYLGLPIIH